MRLGGIGVGQAGGRILDLLAYHDIHGIHKKILPFAIAVNSAQADLLELKVIPKQDRILVGQTQVRGHGAGLIREVGARVVEQQIHLIIATQVYFLIFLNTIIGQKILYLLMEHIN